MSLFHLNSTTKLKRISETNNTHKGHCFRYMQIFHHKAHQVSVAGIFFNTLVVGWSILIYMAPLSVAGINFNTRVAAHSTLPNPNALRVSFLIPAWWLAPCVVGILFYTHVVARVHSDILVLAQSCGYPF